MRRLLRDVAENREVGDATTLADGSVIDLISTRVRGEASDDLLAEDPVEPVPCSADHLPDQFGLPVEVVRAL
jgi:hypothetical protein